MRCHIAPGPLTSKLPPKTGGMGAIRLALIRCLIVWFTLLGLLFFPTRLHSHQNFGSRFLGVLCVSWGSPGLSWARVSSHLGGGVLEVLRV
jgi:hypothetical protein